MLRAVRVVASRGRWRRKAIPLPALALAGVLLAGCGGATLDAAGSSPPTTLVRPATRDDPISVVVSGDSVLDNLSDGLVPALDFGGEAVVSHTWLLGLSRDAASRFEVRRTVAEAHPDVVVVLLGVWELDPLEGEIGTPGWERRYRRDVLEPFVDMVTVDGAHLLWLGMPAIADPVPDDHLEELNRAFAALGEEDPRVTFLDLGAVVEGPDGEFTEHLPGPDGDPVRVRQTDGLHFCPAGTVLADEMVLDFLARHWSVEVADGWEGLDWTRSQGVERGEDRCPED